VSGKSLAIGLILGLIIGLPMEYFLPPILTNLLTPEPLLSTPPVYGITITGNQTTNSTFRNNQYYFTYIKKGVTDFAEPYFAVTTPQLSPNELVYCSATVGSHYDISLYSNQSLQIEVTEVNNDSIGLDVWYYPFL
jgi:hypothetical protein